MELPEFIQSLPELELPFPSSKVKSHAIKSESALMVMFEFLEDFDLPEHSHRAQWGIVIEGELEFTIDGKTSIYKPGDTYDIAQGVMHSAKIPAGTKVIDIFEESDRYPIKT